MTDSREVEFFQISEQRNLLDEIADELTTVQMARLARQMSRLQQYGWTLDGSFFDNVADSKKKLREFRMTLDKVEYRLLFVETEVGTSEHRNMVLEAYRG